MTNFKLLDPYTNDDSLEIFVEKIIEEKKKKADPISTYHKYYVISSMKEFDEKFSSFPNINEIYEKIKIEINPFDETEISSHKWFSKSKRLITVINNEFNLINKFPPSTESLPKIIPIIPPEILFKLEKYDILEKDVKSWIWRTIPQINPLEKRISEEEIDKINAYKLLKPLLGNPNLANTLRTMDIANGCGVQCDTCLADSSNISSKFTYESLEKLFKDKLFTGDYDSSADILKNGMLQSDSLRIGSSGDISDHPDAIKIVNMILEETKGLDEYRQKKENRHKISVFTNYRPSRESTLDAFIDLATQNPRLHLTISLPLNINPHVNEEFKKYLKKRENLFYFSKETLENFSKDPNHKGDPPIRYIKKPTNVSITDIGPEGNNSSFSTGRTIDETILEARKIPTIEKNRSIDHSQRGYVKPYLNPDSLWLMTYTTIFESHTLRAFTPITKKNINHISNLTYHPGFKEQPIAWSKIPTTNLKPYKDILKSIRIGAGYQERPVTIVS
ncbi:hypothetical protein HN827_06990 [archaeon]|nr:hypothetical protein [archaeon]